MTQLDRATEMKRIAQLGENFCVEISDDLPIRRGSHSRFPG